MSQSAKSIFFFGIYVVVLGILLLFVPNALLGVVDVPPTNEVWIRLAGMLLLILGYFYVQAGRHNLVPFFKWTLVTRGIAFFFVLGFWLCGFISWIIIAFWLGDLAGTIWTWTALRKEKNL